MEEMKMAIPTRSESPALNLMLDFDGVAHPFFPCAPNVHDFLSDPPDLHPDVFCRVPLIEDAIRQVEEEGITVRIHLTTSWRKVMSLGKLRTYIGDVLANRTVGATPVLDDNNRAMEVGQYLNEQGRLFDPWICVDDNADLFADFLPIPDSETRLLFIDASTGFTTKDAKRLLEKAKYLCLSNESAQAAI